MTVRLKHPGGSIAEVPEAQALRLIATGVGWIRLGETASPESPESPAEAGSEVVQGDDTPEPVNEPQELSQGQEEANPADQPSNSGEVVAEQVEPFTMEDVRAWARANRPDLNVKESGRVSRAATQAYRDAHNL
jgi:hypothetical protein